ncbi:MAG: hypothetical protein HG424_003075 [candidate division SR1 bacterium]|nr:hypothetical protein [candidate division SR1 bacterium]
MRRSDRVSRGPHSREYLLSSLLQGVLSVLVDKDGKALIFKSDPPYAGSTNWRGR